MEKNAPPAQEKIYQQAFTFSLMAMDIAEKTPIHKFKPKIFNLLKKFINFDAGQWVTRAKFDIDNQRIHPSKNYLDSLDSKKMMDYQLYRKEDRVLIAALEKPNITHDLRKVWSDDEFYASKIYLEHAKKYGLERILCTLVCREQNNFSQVISLYRHQRDHLFEEFERLFVELSCQYMTSAFRLNILKNIAGNIQQPTGKPKVVSDKDGFIFEADENFLNWLHQLYPEFDGKYLPTNLIDNAIDKQVITKDQFSLHTEQVGDLFIILRSSSLDLEKLSSKEKDIILALLKGGSNKSIAREFNNSKTTIDTHLRNIYEKLGFAKSMDNHEKRRQLILVASESPQVEKLSYSKRKLHTTNTPHHQDHNNDNH